MGLKLQKKGVGVALRSLHHDCLCHETWSHLETMHFPQGLDQMGVEIVLGCHLLASQGA